jgi:hypothetical protein
MKIVEQLHCSGTYAGLPEDVEQLTEINGTWRDLGNHKQFRAETGAILNWWQSTGTISFQGPALAAAQFLAKLCLGLEGDGVEIIPPDLLEGVSADLKSVILIDREGELWVDLVLCCGGGEPKIGGEQQLGILCGRRLLPIKPPTGHLRIVN